MTTTIVDPRPAMVSEDAMSRSAVLATSFQRAWETIGNSYEQLTTGIAPGNGGRTVVLPHDHTNGKTGAGTIAAQAPSRWQGRSQLGDSNGPATSFPFGLASLYVWACIVEIYSQQEAAAVIVGRVGNNGGADRPGAVAQSLTLELNGFSMPYGFETSNDPGSWMIAANLGVLSAGTYHLALRVSALSPRGETWSVVGAEVWPNNNNQMVLPP